MVGAIILVTWLLGVIPAGRIFRGSLHEAMYVEGSDDDSFDFWMEAFLGAMAGLFWPLALPIALVGMKPKKSTREYEKEAAQREQHIKDLERDLGYR